jgi:hypothetical protein
MLLTERRRKLLTGGLLTLGVLATRLPFISRYLYEFDSVDFAIATFRFDLSQFTPHPPGYILHVLLGRWLSGITGDINLAFVWLAILLSIGSVLFLWRAASHMRGERVGVVTGVLWLLAPMFWFYGEVATSYVHEAFFASAILYFGIRLIREGSQERLIYGLLIAFSLSIAARQSSVLFFGPAVIYLLMKVRPQAALIAKALALFLIITGCWVLVQLQESGGLGNYMSTLSKERLYTTQSVLFGSPISEHIGVLTKFLWFLLIGSFPVILICAYGLIAFRGDFVRFIKHSIATRTGKYALIVLLPAFLFYSLVYFMKAGYLLNILPSIYLAGAVCLDHIAILHARRVREAKAPEILFTRPLITQFTLILILVIGNLEILWFTLPLPGKEFPMYANLFSHQTFRESITSRYSGQEDKAEFFLNKAFAYSSSAGVKNVDSIHHAVHMIMNKESQDLTKTVILDSWWQRFSYFYFPNSVCYDIRSYDADTLFSSLRMNNYTFHSLPAVDELPENVKNVFIFIRHEHPDLQLLEQQVRLIKVEAPPFIDIYRVEDTSFILKWKNRTFVRK